MSDTTVNGNRVTSQYIARVADDLEDNRKVQERLGTEIAALQSQLANLDKDREVLLSLQEALGATSVPAPSAPEQAPASSADKQPTTAPPKGRKTRSKKSIPAPRKTAGTSTKASGKTAAPQLPSLVSLARGFLAGQTEPRSAAEVAESLAQQHPDRSIKTTVVRTTLEGLVAKNHAQRTKQGSSVFYTAPDTDESSADSGPSPDPTA